LLWLAATGFGDPAFVGVFCCSSSILC
jgi:hypothetical protein